MSRQRLGMLRWTIIMLYLASFALPVGSQHGWMPGITCFALGFLISFEMPHIALIWAANPLFWVGLYYLRRERWDRVAILGTAACLFASLYLVPYPRRPLKFGPAEVLFLSGYFTWLASMSLIAVVGITGWVTRGFAAWPRPRIRSLMIAIALIALLLGLFRTLPRLMA